MTGARLSLSYANDAGDAGFWGGMVAFAIEVRLPFGHYNQKIVTDAQGRWHAQYLIAGLKYAVSLQREENDEVEIGDFIADGGKQLQNVGPMTYDPEANQ